MSEWTIRFLIAAFAFSIGVGAGHDDQKRSTPICPDSTKSQPL